MRTIGDSIPGVVSLLRQRVSIGDVLPLPFRSTNTSGFGNDVLVLVGAMSRVLFGCMTDSTDSRSSVLQSLLHARTSLPTLLGP